MKKLILLSLGFILINLPQLYSQTNTMPTTGDVGIGTLTPSAKLDVNGKLKVDSTAIFKDSVIVKKRLTVDQDIKVLGKSVFVDDGRFKNKLTVLGIAKMKDKLVVDGLTRMNGDAKIFGDLKIKSLENTTITENRFLSLQPNGKVISLDKSELINSVYQPTATCKTDVNGNILSVWKQNPTPGFGILYTGTDCPARVGIGTSSPQTALDVVGKITMRNGATTGYIPTSDANGAMTWTDPNSIINAGLWQANSSNIFFSTGNVGIGTNNPTNKLDVVGTSSFTSNVGIGTPIKTNVQLLVKPTSPAIIGLCVEAPTIGDYNYNIKSIVDNSLAKAIAVTSPAAAQDKFVVWGDGRVNIITSTSPTVKSLSVTGITSGEDVFRVMGNGNVYATKVLVRNVPFPDYVFEKDYDLMPLAKLEEYININKHLPNMPTATAVEKEGADLGEINRILVEKTEELTLYVIALKKELDNLRTEVNTIKKQ
jgi:hypothetical protein